MSKLQLVTNNLNYSFDDRVLFEDLSLSVSTEDRIALIGQNGSGKSTLLKILAGEIAPTSGNVHQESKIGYFAQSYPLIRNLDVSIAEYLMQQDIPLEQIYTSFMRIWLKPIDLSKRIIDLSGGEFTKFMFAIIDQTKPNVLILDEPTNNIDAYSIERLKEYIKYFQGGVVFVSHNLEFISTVPNQIWELEDKSIQKTIASYLEFQAIKKREEESQLAKFSSTNKELRKLQSAYQFEKQRLNKDQVKQARLQKKGTSGVPKIMAGIKKNEAQISSGKKLNNLAIQISNLQKEKSSLQKTVSKKAYLEIESESKKPGLILNVKQAILANNLDFSIYFGDRISIDGANGSGKTTLCKYIFNKTKDNFKVAYLDQKYDVVDLNKSVLENMNTYNKTLGQETNRRFLGNFLFSSKDQVSQKASTLSGGELARLAFAMVTAGEVELLILDEPVNNVDLETLNVIIEGLKTYKGAIIVVSHDKKFLENIYIKTSVSLF